MSEHKKLLTVENLKKYFPLKKKLRSRNKTVLRAVDGVSLEIYEGETFGLVGESGSGKSTLGRTLLRLYEPTDGKILFHDGEKERDLTGLKVGKMRPFRKDLQIIFQDMFINIFSAILF